MASSHLSSSAFDSALECETELLNAKLLKPLDDILRCQICCEYFRNCMVTKCHHNYCSVCIRRYMNYKSQCPTCFQVATEPELRNNRLIDEIIQVYIKMRESLHIPPESIDMPILKQHSSCKSATKENLPETKIAGTSNNNKNCSQQREDTSSNKVPCPVCEAIVPKSRINIHLDICLKKAEERGQRRSLPKLVYHLMSEKDIKKKLKEHGLSTSGDRQALVRRHKNFVTLFNANCDALNPVPVEDLLLEIEQQELAERLSATPRNIQINKRSNPSDIDREHRSYLQEHQSQFNSLIQDVQERALGRHIKQEIDNSEVTTSNITDESGNVIGESIFSVRNVPLLEPVTVKKELSDSSLEGVNLRRSLLSSSEESLSSLSDSDPVIIKEEPPESLYEDPYIEDNQALDPPIKSEIYDIEPDSDSNKSSQLPFRVKKSLPVMKIKEEPQFLLDSISNQEYTADNPSSKEDFETSKKQSNKCHKKKYARRLSVEEKKNHRKK